MEQRDKAADGGGISGLYSVAEGARGRHVGAHFASTKQLLAAADATGSREKLAGGELPACLQLQRIYRFATQ